MEEVLTLLMPGKCTAKMTDWCLFAFIIPKAQCTWHIFYGLPVHVLKFCKLLGKLLNSAQEQCSSAGEWMHGERRKEKKILWFGWKSAWGERTLCIAEDSSLSENKFPQSAHSLTDESSCLQQMLPSLHTPCGRLPWYALVDFFVPQDLWTCCFLFKKKKKIDQLFLFFICLWCSLFLKALPPHGPWLVPSLRSGSG